MSDSAQAEYSVIPPAEKKLLAGAERRMAAGMWVLGFAAAALCWLWQGWRTAGGFAVGAILSALNFHWMKTAVASLADLAAPPTAGSGGPVPRPNTARVAIRLMLRYALIGVAGYAIFKSSFVSLGAFFLGLFLFLGAILVELAYEIYFAFRNA